MNEMKDRVHTVYSFISYKGGSARTSALVNCALGLVVEGQHVLLIDLDLEAPGLPIFSSVKEPDPLFQPNHLYALDDLSTPISERERQDERVIELNGWLSVLDGLDGNDPGDELDWRLESLPVYECRSPYGHPLEGRLFLLPIGGRFQYAKSKTQTATTVEATEWSYFPPDKRDVAVLLELQRSNWIFSDKHRLFKNLIDKSASSIRAVGVEIDYVLLDERPGITLRSLLASARPNADGVVIIGRGTRGNLAGVRDLVTRIASNSDFPPVTGIVLSPLLQEVTSDKGSAVSASRAAIIRDEEQINLGGAIKKLLASGNVELPSQEYFETFLDLARETYVFPDTSFQRASTETKSAHPLWGGVWQSQRTPAQTLDKTIPVLFDDHLYINDRPLGIRAFARTGVPYANDALNIASAFILTGHLRYFNRDKDVAFRAWAILRKDMQSATERDWSFVTADRKPWRCFWYKALWHEIRGELDLAWEFLDQALNLQREQCGTLDVTWPGDWRLFLKKGRLLRNGGRAWYELVCTQAPQSWEEQVEDHYRSALSSLDYEKGIPFNGTSTRRLVDVSANVHQELAQFLAAKEKVGQHDIEEAYRHYRLALDDGCVLPELVNGVVDFVVHNWARLNEADCFGYVETHLAKLAQRHDLRAMVVLPLARLRLAKYWAAPINENRRFVDEAIRGLRDWEQLKTQGDVPADARGPGLLGEALLEAAAYQTSVLQYHYILQSIEQFEKATQQHLSSFRYHLYLAVSRILEYTNPNSPFRLREGKGTASTRESVASAFGDELSIRKRDGFYAFEQAVALQADSERPTYYFEGNDAKELAELLPSAIQVLSDIHGDSTLSRRIHKWFDRVLPPEYIQTDSLRRVEQLLQKPGLHPGRTDVHREDQQEAHLDRVGTK